MLEVTTMIVIHVISEPGDATRYDYLVNVTGDDYSFAPVGSVFRFPQCLNYWAVRDATFDDMIAIAKEQNCNPYTVKECIRFIIEDQK